MVLAYHPLVVLAARRRAVPAALALRPADGGGERPGAGDARPLRRRLVGDVGLPVGLPRRRGRLRRGGRPGRPAAEAPRSAPARGGGRGPAAAARRPDQRGPGGATPASPGSGWGSMLRLRGTEAARRRGDPGRRRPRCWCSRWRPTVRRCTGSCPLPRSPGCWSPPGPSWPPGGRSPGGPRPGWLPALVLVVVLPGFLVHARRWQERQTPLQVDYATPAALRDAVEPTLRGESALRLEPDGLTLRAPAGSVGYVEVRPLTGAAVPWDLARALLAPPGPGTGTGEEYAWRSSVSLDGRFFVLLETDRLLVQLTPTGVQVDGAGRPPQTVGRPGGWAAPVGVGAAPRRRADDAAARRGGDQHGGRRRPVALRPTGRDAQRRRPRRDPAPASAAPAPLPGLTRGGRPHQR